LAARIAHSTLAVGQVAMVVTEFELAQIPMQALVAD